MKTKLLKQFMIAKDDRSFMALLIGVAFVAVLYCLYVAFSVHAQDISLAVRYTAFGETHFYKDKWYYLLQFIGFGIIVGVSHLLIMVKIYSFERHQAARIVGWMTILLFFIAFMFTQAVLGIAYI